jgi:hypothetical protein
MQLNQQHQRKLFMNVRYVRVIIGKYKREIIASIFGFDFSKWLDLINNQRVGKDIHEEFHRELDNQQDKFGVIAEFLGRRLFDKVK